MIIVCTLILKILNAERVYLRDYWLNPLLERLVNQLELQVVGEECGVDVEPESSWGQLVL